jgi:hexosaminidase
MHRTWSMVAGVCLIWAAATQSSAQESRTDDAGKGGVKIIPAPRLLVMSSGPMALGDQIVADGPALRPLAGIVQGEIQLLTGKRLSVTTETPRAGDIVLKLDAALAGETYRIEVKDTATVSGGNYAAIAFGTVSLLQSVAMEQGKPALPGITVRDEPAVGFRGLMVDAARQWHSVGTLKQIIELCRWYKIRQLQIHFTDDQSFTFPSTAFPKLQTPERHYTVEQLRELEAYARDRGVEILPELETPGHASAMVKQMPEVFANNPPSGNVICPGREETYRALDTLIGEMTDIFRTTPYFHIGADEVGMDPWKACKDCQACMAAQKLDDVKELYRYFVVRVNEIVKKRGKKMIVWEGFHKDGKTEIPRDVTVMVFESLYNIAPDLIGQGYSVINTSWQPLYVVNQRNWSPEYIYGWNMYRWENWWDQSKAFKNPITVAPTKMVLGAEICAWEQPEKAEIPSLRLRLAALSERLWNPDAGRDYKDFADRLSSSLDPMLSKVLPALPEK